MSLEEYPHNDLPLPEGRSYGLERGQRFIRTDMEAGNIRQRTRFSTIPDDLQVTWVMSREQFELFEGWFKHKINNGADWFRMKVSDGSGVNLQDCRFKTSYKAKEVGPNFFSVTASLETRDRTIIDEATVDSRITP